MTGPGHSDLEFAVVGFAWPHEVYTTGKLKAPAPRVSAVLPLTFKCTSALVRLEGLDPDMAESFELVPGPPKILITGEAEKADVVVGGPVDIVTGVPNAQVQSAESQVLPDEVGTQSGSAQGRVGSSNDFFDDGKTVRSETFSEAWGHTKASPQWHWRQD